MTEDNKEAGNALLTELKELRQAIELFINLKYGHVIELELPPLEKVAGQEHLYKYCAPHNPSQDHMDQAKLETLKPGQLATLRGKNQVPGVFRFQEKAHVHRGAGEACDHIFEMVWDPQKRFLAQFKEFQ